MCLPSCACALGLPEKDMTWVALMSEEAEETQRTDLDPTYSLEQSPAKMSFDSEPTHGGGERAVRNDWCVKPPSLGGAYYAPVVVQQQTKRAFLHIFLQAGLWNGLML